MLRAAGLATVLLLAAMAPPALAQSTFEAQVVELVNLERWNNGQLAPLKGCGELEASAEGHSEAMASRDFFAHCDVDEKTSPWDRIVAAGYTPYSYAAENIAAGYVSPADVMTGWMNSSGHRANILSTNVREIGVGYVYQGNDQANVRRDSNGDCTSDSNNGGPYRHYWTQNFGRIGVRYPVVIERERIETESRTVALYVYGAGWAQEMRFRNEDGEWSAWEPYAAGKTWTLSAGNGTKTVACELRNGTTVRTSADSIELAGQATATPGDGGIAVAAGLRVLPASPNPFRAATLISFDLHAEGPASAAVFDVTGRRVCVLADGRYPAGRHEVRWDGRDGSGREARPGLYFVRVRAAGSEAAVKVLYSR